MRYLTAADERKIKAMAKGEKAPGKVLRVVIGCIIEVPIDELGNGDEVIEQTLDRCREYGTGEIVDITIIRAKDEASA